MSGAGGSLIFLHGASSAGKTTLARALLPLLPRPFWHLSIDHFRDSGVWQMARFEDRDLWRRHRRRYFDGFHGTVSAALATGNDVLLEHILDTEGWRSDLQARWGDFDVFFVGLRTDLAVLQAREVARADRPLGSARQDAETIHQGLRYDLTLDGGADPEHNAAALIAAWEAPRGRSHFFDAP